MKKIVFVFCLIGIFSISSAELMIGLGGNFKWEFTLSKSKQKQLSRLFKKHWQKQQPTYEQIENLQGYYNLSLGKEKVGYLVIRTANGCSVGGCNSPIEIEDITQNSNAVYEDFQYAMALNKNLDVLGVTILEYNSLHGFEITAKSWLKQFKGYHGEELTVGKNIDGITGATISANSICKDIEAAYVELAEVLN